MSLERLMAKAAGLLAIAAAAVPISLLHAQGNPSDLNADSEFIRDVASDNLLEIRLGRVAESKAQNPAVKQFGQQMVTDHTRMQEQWVAMVSKYGMRFQPGLNDLDEERVKQLEKVSGSEFDRAYMNIMIQGHQENVGTFQTQGSSAQSVEVRQLVAANLPILQQHFSLANQVGSQVGAQTSVTAAGQPPTVSTLPPPVANQPAPVGAQPTTVEQANVRGDGQFIREVSADNLLEVRLAQLAQSKAENSAVKQFAQQMITDHTRLQEQWTAMASRNGMTLQPGIGPLHRQKLDRLQRVSGGEFDRVYMTLMIRDHNNQVDYFENEGRSAQSAEVRQLVTAGLPTLQQHLSLAKQIGIQVGADTTAGRYAEGRSGDGRADVRADREFIRDIGAANTMEIRLGQMAQKKGKTRAVKEFGERMVTDHTKLQNRWTSMASRNGFKLGMGMGENRQEKVDRLEKVSGKAFDRAYMETVIETHQAIVNYFQKEGRAADAGPVRRHVADDLPIWQQHLRMARQIGRQVGADNRNRQASVTR